MRIQRGFYLASTVLSYVNNQRLNKLIYLLWLSLGNAIQKLIGFTLLIPFFLIRISQIFVDTLSQALKLVFKFKGRLTFYLTGRVWASVHSQRILDRQFKINLVPLISQVDWINTAFIARLKGALIVDDLFMTIEAFKIKPAFRCAL